MAEPDIYAKFAELYIEHERLKQKYAELLKGHGASQLGRWSPLYVDKAHSRSNAEYLLEQEDV